MHPWLLGINRGAKADTLELLGERLDEIYDGRKVLLVGWSLGGMFARELAHRYPGQGARGGDARARPSRATSRPTPTCADSTNGSRGMTSTSRRSRGLTGKPPVPTLALWSRRDGIVAPSAARGLRP